MAVTHVTIEWPKCFMTQFIHGRNARNKKRKARQHLFQDL